MPRLPGVPDDIALLNGPMLLGNLFGYGLFGILIVQVSMYYYRFPKDPIWMKTLVWSVFSIDILVTIFATIAVWNSLAAGWGDLSVLAPLDWPFGGMPLLSGLVSSSVHFFFCWRMWKLSKMVILPVFIGVLSITQWIMASYCGITGLKLGITRIGELKPFVIVWLGGSALCDVLITAAMVAILFRKGSKSSFLQTNDLMSKLIMLTVETGMATTFGALAELILFVIFPHNNMHFLPFLVLAKLYSNTLLATLNARAILNDRNTPKPALWDDQSSVAHISVGRGHLSTKPPPPGVVQITTITERHGGDMEMAITTDHDEGSLRKYPPYDVSFR